MTKFKHLHLAVRTILMTRFWFLYQVNFHNLIINDKSWFFTVFQRFFLRMDIVETKGTFAKR